MDCPPLCDYSNVHLERASKEYFDFELEKHALPVLKGMIAAEVTARVDAVPTEGAARPVASTEGGEGSLATAPEAEGPMSQMKTQKAPSAADHANPYASAGRDNKLPPRRRPSNEQEPRRRPSKEMEAAPPRRRPSQELERGTGSGNIRDLERALEQTRLAASQRTADSQRSSNVIGLLSQFQTSYRSLSAQMGDRASASSGPVPEKPATADLTHSQLVRAAEGRGQKKTGRVLPSLLRR